MVIKKKRKDFHEEKKKKVKTIIEIEENVQTVIKTEDNGHLKKKKKTKKKENLKDECLHKLQPKKNNNKKKDGSELLRAGNLESFVNIKGPVDLQLEEESEEQIKILRKKKKKIQCHFSLENNESSDVELSGHHTDGTKKNELPFKKKRKKTALDMELDGEVTKKKKKKGSFSLEDIQDSEQKQYAKVYKNTHKYISREAVFMGENNGTDDAQNGEESFVRRKKKKKRDKSDCFLPLVDNQDNNHPVPGSLTALSDFRKRKKHNSWEYSLTSREEEYKIKNFGSIKERKKKRKEISSSTCEEDKPDYSYSFLDKYLPAQQKVELEEEELSGKKHRKKLKDIKKKKKKMKKKKEMKKKEKETTYSEVSLNNDSASKSQKILLESNKKNRESERERAQCVTGDTVDGALCNRNPVQCDRKEKKRKKVPAQDFAEEPGSKADPEKIKTESPWNESPLLTLCRGKISLAMIGKLSRAVNMETTANTLQAVEKKEDGVIIVQEKKGNCDEMSIDKVRRQALQEEIDRESGKTKAFSSQVGQETKLGQWSTAAFKSSEEQTKFFRLMGGFKKGSVPIQNPSVTTNKPNMALNKEGQEKLQQALKMEFDKAMDLKQHRGIGLGFQPTANKKVYIDKYTSRSIKFED